ncbi:MAG: hypothetical protein AB1540_06395 [Bdellovibrionota bacterium]
MALVFDFSLVGMERWHTQEKLSHLVNIDALLGKLSQPVSARKTAVLTQPDVSESEVESDSSLVPLEIRWPKEVLSLNLRDRIEVTPRKPLEGLEFSATQASESKLNALFDLFVKDVMNSRDQLLSLNPGRRKLVERRLEYIARKVARARGEKLNRSISLPELLRESYREQGQPLTKLSSLAWKAFVGEVAIYQMLQIFFLKCLDRNGWRPFENEDLVRMNFAAHSFLNHKAAGFAHDKHAWNFVRTNLYSWYIPSQKVRTELVQILGNIDSRWSSNELVQWFSTMPSSNQLGHLEFPAENKLAQSLLDLIENQLGVPLVSNFQGHFVCRKIFIPALEMGGFALSALDRMMSRLRNAQPKHNSEFVALSDTSQIHRSIWACESESLEAFWVEVLVLMKLLAATQTPQQSVARPDYSRLCPITYQKIPQAVHVVQMLSLELHNMDQLPLGGPEVCKLHQGSAAQIQQLETFDLSVVLDSIDRAKSGRWMKALADQLPYWRNLVTASSNLNWGELHLHLSLTKLKEDGLCLYLSHRQLPEGGDGDRFRKLVLNTATLEYFLELPEETELQYRYLYVFRKVSNKLERDQHRPKFGRLKPGALIFDHNELEEANSTQAEIGERGWEHLFVRGAAPLMRHLNQKFPKLFQVATVQHETIGSATSLFSGSNTKALEVVPSASGDTVTRLDFIVRQEDRGQAKGAHKAEHLLVFPHNPSDLPWIQCLLNSKPAQFWIRHQVLTAGMNKQNRMQDLKSCPIVDLSRAPADAVHEALDWMGSHKPDFQTLRSWACHSEGDLTERYSKYVAMARRYATLDRIVSRYRPLFTSPSFDQLRPEAIGQFYPTSLLSHVLQSPDLRIQYTGRERCAIAPEIWTITEIHSIVKNSGAGAMAYTVVHTRQGPTIQLMFPAVIRDYMNGQLKNLRDHTWGEALSLLLIPRDIQLFGAQTAEITRVVCETAREIETYQKALDELALELFEIPDGVRQFLA